MTTFTQLKEEVLLKIHGFTDKLEKVTSLTSSPDSDDLTFTVADIGQVSRGLVEIDNELLYVQRTDSGSSTVTVYPFGRGYRGTTAASHASGAMVTVDPSTPRIAVTNAINDVVLAVYPDIFNIKISSQTLSAVQVRYELPSDAQEVMSLRWAVTGPSLLQAPVRRYSVEPRLESDSVPLAVNVFDGVEPGRTLRVAYMAKPTVFSDSAGSDTLADHGFAESAKDLLVYGACARLLGYMDAGRLMDADSPNASAMTNQLPIGVATQVSRQMYTLYQQRLAEEHRRLMNRWKPQSHFVQ